MNKKIFIFGLILLVTLSASVGNTQGSGKIKLGMNLLDEEGNLGVSQSSFNRYEGFALSFEKFNYSFSSGIKLKADLRNITLNNRNLNFNLYKTGLFGIRLQNNQYRRIYDFDGNHFTRRHQTAGSLWFYPHRSVKLFAGGDYFGKSGLATRIFNSDINPTAENIDFNQSNYNLGFRFNDQGYVVQSEYRRLKLIDDIDKNNNRTGKRFRLIAQGPLPVDYDITLSGGYQYYRTTRKLADITLISNRGWLGLNFALPSDFSGSYSFIFDRTGSDSDLVETDNLSHTFYLTHIWAGKAALTGGFQSNVNDDYDTRVGSNSYYLSGWYRPLARLEIKGEYGNRVEKVTDGYRLTGQEDRQRFKVKCKYSKSGTGSIHLSYDGRWRKNEQIEGDVDFVRLGLGGDLVLPFGHLTAGYSYSSGEYSNSAQVYEFISNIVYGNLRLDEFLGFTPGLGGQYYRAKRGVDIERFNINLNITWQFIDGHSLEMIYNLDSFDDFLEVDQYYTGNIIEFNLIKNISF